MAAHKKLPGSMGTALRSYEEKKNETTEMDPNDKPIMQVTTKKPVGTGEALETLFMEKK